MQAKENRRAPLVGIKPLQKMVQMVQESSDIEAPAAI